MGVLVDWPGEATEPRKFVFLVSEGRPPACAQEALAAEQAARKREELNALYVAMTRARHTLVISSIEPHRTTIDSWWQRLQEKVPPLDAPAPPIPFCGRWPAAPGHDGASWLLGPAAEVFYLPELPAFEPPAPEPAAEGSVQEDPANARVGKAMHRLLEWGGRSSAEHVGAVAREFRLNPAQAQEACALAQCILKGEGAWAWSDEAVAWHGDEIDLVYQGLPLRLDRLVRRKDAGFEGQWWVLDYKSAPEPELQPALITKMRIYRAAVQRIYPRATVKAAFLTGRGTVVELE